MMLAAAVIALPGLVRLAMMSHLYASIDDVPIADTAIVLGASTIHGQQSPILAARSDTAVALFHKGKVQKILITGDGQDSNYNEILPVHAYMRSAGIPESDILLDYEGMDTYDSMVRAYTVFAVSRAIIVTQDFHLPRAVFLARAIGINADGVAADEGTSKPFNYIREIPANVKALWQIMLLEGTRVVAHWT